MEHAATLDLEDFEDSELQDSLERARRQASGRLPLLGQLFGQAQDIITIVSFAAGLIAYAPGLIGLLLVALVPAFLGELHFSARSYSLDYGRTPERRELDYVRQTGASVETAKEVKIFGLNAFLIDRYKTLADGFYRANRALAERRALWGGLLTTIGTMGYYVAYGLIAWRTLRGDFTIGDLTFLAGSFRRLRTLLESLLSGLSQVAGQALYLDDLFSFFEVRPEIVSAPDARPFPQANSNGLCLRGRGLHLSGSGALGRAPSVLCAERGRGAGAGGRKWRRQDDAGQAAGAPVRPRRRAHPSRRARPEGLRPGRSATEHRRDFPGLRALSLHGRRKHRCRSHRGPRRPCPHRRSRQTQCGRRGDRAAAAEDTTR